MSEEAQPAEKAVATARVGLAGKQLKELAQQGGFAVDDSTGNEMIRSLQGVIDSLEERWNALAKLTGAPPMSSTATARWVSQHMVGTATDAQGLITQLNAARAEFPAYVEAIELAKRNYSEREQDNRQTLTRIDPES